MYFFGDGIQYTSTALFSNIHFIQKCRSPPCRFDISHREAIKWSVLEDLRLTMSQALLVNSSGLGRLDFQSVLTSDPCAPPRTRRGRPRPLPCQCCRSNETDSRASFCKIRKGRNFIKVHRAREPRVLDFPILFQHSTLEFMLMNSYIQSLTTRLVM